MMLLLSRAGLRYNDRASAAGAQTERRGEAGPVRDLLGGLTSPAALLVLSIRDADFDRVPGITRYAPV
jgi:hypothetical protein